MKSESTRFILSLLTLLGLGSAVAWSRNGDIQFGAGILGTFVVLPLTIVLYRDMARAAALDTQSASGRFFLGLPLRALGTVSLLIGLAIILWIAYNLFIEKQPEFTTPEAGGMLLIPVLLIGLGWRWLKKPLASPEDEEAA